MEDLGDAFWCFLDWGDGLNKQAGATAVLIYCIRYGIRLAKILDKQEDISWLEREAGHAERGSGERVLG